MLDHSQPIKQSVKPELTRDVDKIIENVTAVAMTLAHQLERHVPGHRHGLKKQHDHVSKMVNELPALSEAYGFTGETAQLARIIFAAHDLGRPRSAIFELDKRPYDQNHGLESVNELRERGTLSALDKRQRLIVEFALINHSVRSVPLVDEVTKQVDEQLGRRTDSRDIAQLAYDLTYFLRDRDKVDIFLKGNEYLDPPETLKELKTWYLKNRPALNLAAPFSEATLKNPNFNAVAINCLRQLLNSGVGATIEIAPNLDLEMQKAVVPVLTAIMNGGIESRTAEEFLASRACDKGRIGFSYSTYMLYAIAFVFDVKHTATIREIHTTGVLNPWLGFLELKLPKNEFIKYRDHLYGYINERLKGDL